MTSDNVEILAEIEHSMSKLVRNDKIAINSLSFLADDYKENEDVYPKIVDLIETQLLSVHLKLPLLYLIDSIMKNVGQPYIDAFSVNLVRIFSHSFEETQDPASRRKLYDLRKTWVDVFPSEILFALDRKVNTIDPAWPIAPSIPDESRVIHINPKFLKSEAIEELPSPTSSSEKISPPAKHTTGSIPPYDRRMEVKSEIRNTSQPLQLPLPPFFRDVPRPTGVDAVPVSKSSTESKTSSKHHSSSTLRDPRLQRTEAENTEQVSKRNSPPRNGISKKRKLVKPEAVLSDEEMDTGIFLIDRVGDDSIEKKAARKKTKTKKPSKTSQKKEDQDLRRAVIPIPPPPLPALPPPPDTLKASADVDMRQPRDAPYHQVTLPPPSLPPRPDMPSRPPPPPPLNFRQPPQMPLQPPRPHPGYQRPPIGNQRPMRSGPRMPLRHMNRPMGPYGRPLMNRGNIPPNQGNMPNRPYGPQPPGPRLPQNSGSGPRVGPLKIDNPRWIVRIPGLDDMPVIGTDPRLLTPCAQDPDHAVQEVTISHRSYTLLLDRLQPMIQVEGYYHAVRYRVEYFECVFRHGIHLKVPGNGSTRITLGNKKFTVCIGGPHHELIIDGRPYSVNFNGEVSTMQLKDMTVPVKIVTPRPRNLDVLPAIPTQILRWANGAHFGPPAMLHLPPLNPIERIELQNASANISEKDITGETSQVTQPTVAAADTPMVPTIGTGGTKPATSSPLDVFSLFDKLVKHGLVEKKKEQPKLDLDAFILSDFLETNEIARKTLYEGYQCTQCGQRYFNPESEEFTAHLDYHFITNNSSMQSGGKSRAYFETADMWLRGTCGPAGQDDTDSEGGLDNNMDEANQPTVEALSDDELNQCSVCFERFEIRYSDDEEAWLLINAVKKEGLFYHPICVEDAWKGVAVDMAVDPHLALKKVLEGKMEAVYKPDADESDSSDEDGVQVIVKSEERDEEAAIEQTSERQPKDEDTSNVPDESPTCPADPKETSEPQSPETPLLDETQCDPSTPLADEKQFSHELEAIVTTKSDTDPCEQRGPQTPVQDETVESTMHSNDSSLGTPVRDEIEEPGTPVKDEPIWAC